ncbi:hypothetical protein HMPREF1633_15140 [Tissierellia bacterium S5-A11]|nr:hypothetical protein HMPREF1633_15140 [Tissierellia bacterium S5-A11]
MKLTDLQLQRYGIYQNVSWQPPAAGLTVICGENESGKTTLLQFVRDMLFGYRRGKRRGRKGNLAVELANGRVYRIHRDEGETKVTDDRLETVIGEPADLWWNGLDRNTYEQVFAIGLEDLQGAAILAQDDVRAGFLSMQGGEQLARTQRDVANAREELLVASPQGKRVINQLLNDWQKAQNDVAALAGEEEEFAAIRREQNEVDAQIKAAEEAIAALDVRDRTMDKQIGAWEYYREGIETKRRLDLCSTIEHFPADGKERWNKLVQRMADVNEQREAVQQKLAAIAPTARQDVVTLEPERDEIAALYRESERWRELQQEQIAKNEALAVWQQEFAARTETMAAWPMAETEKLGTVDWTKGRELAAQLLRRDNELHYWENDEPVIEAAQEIKTADVPRLTDETEFQNWEQEGQEMLLLAREKQHLTDEIEWLETLPVKRYSAFFWLGFLLVLGALAAFYLYFTGGLGMEALYIVGGALALSLLCFYWNYRKSHQNEYRLAKLNARLAELQARQTELAQRLELAVPETESELENFRQELETARRDFYRYQTQLQAISWQAESERRQRLEHEKWAARGAKLRADREVSEGEWTKWLAAEHLPPTEAAELDLRQAQWQELFTAKGEGEILRVQLERIDRQLTSYTERTASLLQRIGETAPATPETIIELADRYQEQMLQWQSLQEKNRRHEELSKEKALLDERWTLCENEMKALFALVDAKDAAEFVDKVSAYEECDQLRKDYERVRQNLRLYAGSEAEFNRLWLQLETGAYETWLDRRDQYERSLSQRKTELTQLRQREGALQSELARLIKDDRLTKALERRAQVETQLQAAVDDYLALVVSEYLLDEARRAYEADGKPNVIARAGQYLSQMTSGRYTLALTAEGVVQTIDSTHGTKEAAIWSSGTGDQVYLALRLALALAFGEKTEPMPIILDDIFVRFDETRQRETLRFLLAFARTRQVLLFTCHQRTAELAKEVDADNHGHYYRLRSGTISAE